MLEQAYHVVARDFGMLLGRLWLQKIDDEIWKFTQPLDQWLHHLFLHPTPAWREHLDAFLEEQAAAGFTVTPASQAELVAFLEDWARTLPPPATQSTVPLPAYRPAASTPSGFAKLSAPKKKPHPRPPQWADKKPTLSDEEALFQRKLAEADRYLDNIERLLQPIAQKVDAAKENEDLDLNAEVDEIAALIFSHNDAMESARGAWLKGDLGRDTFDRLMLARSPASLGLPLFANDAQAKRAGVQWKKIGERLKERIAFLDNVILALQVMEAAGDVASLALGGPVLLKAFKAGGKVLVAKTIFKTVVAGAASTALGKAVESGMRAAGVDEETIEGVQHAVIIVSWLLQLRGLYKALPSRPKAELPKPPELRQSPPHRLTPKPAPKSSTGTGLVPAPPVELGKWGEARLRVYFGGRGFKPTKAYKTSLGNRYIDWFLDNVAHEAKAGINVTLGAKIRKQALKDAELVASGKVDAAHWHFFQGADKELLDFLGSLGIRYTVH
jgi:hypothetical protein